MFIPEIKSKPNEDISILFRLDNHSHNYICECGDASGLGVKECQNTKAIFISHTHIDHFVNFDQILRHQIGTEQRVVITGPKDIHLQVQAKIRGYSWNLIKPGAIVYEIREIVSESEVNIYEVEPPVWELKKLKTLNTNTVYGNDRFQVNFVILDHKLPVIAYLFKEADSVKIDLGKAGFKGGRWVKELKQAFETRQIKRSRFIGETQTITIEDKAYKAEELFYLLDIKHGDSLGVIMDHAATEENHAKIKSLFANANKVFIECFYKTEEKEMAVLNYHSYAEQSGKIMQACGVKEPVPVHFSRKYSPAEIEQIRKEFFLQVVGS